MFEKKKKFGLLLVWFFLWSDCFYRLHLQPLSRLPFHPSVLPFGAAAKDRAPYNDHRSSSDSIVIRPGGSRPDEGLEQRWTPANSQTART